MIQEEIKHCLLQSADSYIAAAKPESLIFDPKSRSMSTKPLIDSGYLMAQADGDEEDEEEEAEYPGKGSPVIHKIILTSLMGWNELIVN